MACKDCGEELFHDGIEDIKGQCVPCAATIWRGCMLAFALGSIRTTTLLERPGRIPTVIHAVRRWTPLDSRIEDPFSFWKPRSVVWVDPRLL